ncbi:MAG TPA: SsrA-binding protein SmpB [Candidatus Saccharimonadales bacterium]|nr:SsrA-binding protein SmpB [Candidatus Saccharimonadales bacterium]
MTSEKVNIFNKRGLYDNEVLEKFTAGIVLKGYEVKAIREGKVNFEAAYVTILGDEIFLLNLNIGQYSKNGRDLSDEQKRRTRKLLLNKDEIEKIRRLLQQKGRTAIPLALITHNNLVKLELAVVRGRKEYGKKHLEKEKQIKKDLERDSKEFRRSTDV